MNKSLDIKKKAKAQMKVQSGLRLGSNVRPSHRRSKSDRNSESMKLRPKSKLSRHVDSSPLHSNRDLIKSYTVRTRGGKNGMEDKINQDSFIANYMLNGTQDTHLFGVYDGHGNLAFPLKIILSTV